jgi:hypothetical protein
MTLKQFLEALALRLSADPPIALAPPRAPRLDFEPTQPAVHQPERPSRHEAEPQDTLWEA